MLTQCYLQLEMQKRKSNKHIVNRSKYKIKKNKPPSVKAEGGKLLDKINKNKKLKEWVFILIIVFLVLFFFILSLFSNIYVGSSHKH